jgi:hypothetical protein
MWYKGNAASVTGRGGPQGCETPRFPHFLDNRLSDGGEVVSLKRRPPFIPQEDSWGKISWIRTHDPINRDRPCRNQSSWLQTQRSRVRFPALPDFLRSSGSRTGSTQSREDNWGAISRKYRLWLENRDRGDPLRWPRYTLYQQNLALTSLTSCGRSVGIVRLRTTSHGVYLLFVLMLLFLLLVLTL